MVLLSIFNPQHIFTTFARAKYFYAKFPILADFFGKKVDFLQILKDIGANFIIPIYID
jgi:hypothetical protein